MADLQNQKKIWDIFCTVIDNYGDAGVCWRLAHNLAQRQQQVRLWIDDPSCLQWMAPSVPDGISVHHWQSPLPDSALPAQAGDVLIEAFGCHLDDSVQAWWAQQFAPGKQWINLEYLSAEDYVARCHQLQSPVMSGSAKGLRKTFFYPGFTADTGGLLREIDLIPMQSQHQAHAFLRQLGCQQPHLPTVSLFCYEPAALEQWRNQWAQQPCNIMVMQGRGLAALCQHLHVKQLPAQYGQAQLYALPWLSQPDFDRVLWSCQFNAVRGEDSLVRALWAGLPLLWHIYPQDDNAHHDKLQAFLDWIQAPSGMQQWHYAWNGMAYTHLPALTPSELQSWADCAQAVKAKLLQQPDLASQLIALL